MRRSPIFHFILIALAAGCTRPNSSAPCVSDSCSGVFDSGTGREGGGDTGTAIGGSSDDLAGSISGSDGGAGSDGGRTGGSLVIDSLTGTPSPLGPGQLATFTAVVRDPLGSTDIVGGQLLSLDGNTHFGSFASAGNDRFTIVVSWDDLDRATPFNFTGAGTTTVVAEFVDQRNQVVDHSTTLAVDCGTSGNAACNGACVTAAANGCGGSCGATCGHDQACSGGSCVQVANLIVSDAVSDCTSVCTNLGFMGCTSACTTSDGPFAQEAIFGASAPQKLIYSASCSNTPPSSVVSGGTSLAFSEQKCCCTLR